MEMLMIRNLARMRHFQKDQRLQGTSLPEIVQEMDRLRIKLRRGTKINNKSVHPGPFLNAILVHFLDMSEEQQKEVYDYGRRRLEELLASEEMTGEWQKPEKPPSGGQGGKGELKPMSEGFPGQDEPAPAKPRRRKRNG